MIVDPRQLTNDDANELAARRSFNADKLFYRHGVADIIDQRRSVVEAIRVWNDLCPSDLLAAFGESSMEIADLYVTIEHLLAFKFQIKLDGPVGRRMGWTHLELHGFER